MRSSLGQPTLLVLACVTCTSWYLSACDSGLEVIEVEDVEFVETADAGRVDTSVESDAATGSCTIGEEASCADGEKCAPDLSGATCVEAGTRLAFEPCARGGFDDCDASALCAGDSLGSDTPICRALCEESSDCESLCGASESCVSSVTCEALVMGGQSVRLCGRIR